MTLDSTILPQRVLTIDRTYYSTRVSTILLDEAKHTVNKVLYLLRKFCTIVHHSTTPRKSTTFLALCKVRYLLTVIFYYDQSDVACGGFVSLSMVNPQPAERSPLF